MSDIETYLSPVSPEEPSGANLEYDLVFAEMERLSRGEEERFAGGEAIPSKEPNWKDLRRVCVDLFGRTRDLRVGVQFARAETALNGVAGLSQGAALLRGLLEQQWATVFPQLDPGDDYGAATARANALATLTDMEGVLGVLRNTPLVESARVGRFSFRDLDIAENRATPQEGANAPTLDLMLGALTDAGEDKARERLAALNAAIADVDAIDAVFARETPGQGPDLDALKTQLGHAVKFLERGLPGEGSAEQGADAGAAPASTLAAVGGTGGGAAGELRNRDDAKRILEQVCRFFERTEPSNPAPILIRRALSLLDRNFMDIIQNLAPAALEEMQKLAGPTGQAGPAEQSEGG